MPCKAKNAKGQPCKKPTRLDYCTIHSAQGGNVVTDYVKHAAAPLTRRIRAIKEGPAFKPTSRFEQFLNKTSDRTVIQVHVGRKPILAPIRAGMHVLSMGRLSKTQKELNYSDVYHNYMLYTLSDGSRWKVEKNHVVEFAKAKDRDYKESWEVPLGDKELTLKGMVDAAAQGNERSFWRYRAGSDNCQAFTRDMVEKNGLLPTNAPHDLVQDAPKLIDAMPPVMQPDRVANLVTDIAATADRVIHGDGISQRKQIHNMLFRRLN